MKVQHIHTPKKKKKKKRKSFKIKREIWKERKMRGGRKSCLWACWLCYCLRDSRYASGYWGLTYWHKWGRRLWQKEWRCPRGRWHWQNIHRKELSDIFHNIKSAENKMLEAHPNLERIMKIHQGIEKMPTPYVSYKMIRKGRHSLKLFLVSFLQRNKAL